MDLYIQVGVILVMASMFALVAYMYGSSTALGIDIHKRLDKPSVNYSLDSSVTSPTIFVDSRVFVQWAVNKKNQRDVYLKYPAVIKPDSALYKEYMYHIEDKTNNKDVSDRRLTIEAKPGKLELNAFKVKDQSPKTLDYLTAFSQQAKQQGTNKMITVYTFINPSTEEVIYVCYIK